MMLLSEGRGMKDTIDKEKKKVAGKGDEPDLTLT
jgi:hypothetical protein